MTIKELFSDPAKWTRGSYAKTRDGATCAHYDREAVCWCSYGAAFKVYPQDDGWLEAIHKMDLAASRLFGGTMFRVNEDLGYEAVMKVVEEAGV